jgi:uncharacterized protein
MADWSSKAFWLRQFRQWHWISAAVCLVGTLLFAVTGITLNHASQINAEPKVASRTATLPPDVRGALTATPSEANASLPPPVRQWLQRELDVKLDGRPGEWSDDEVYVALARPGGDAWLSVDRATGEVEYEKTTRGWIALLNDLHKGRNTGPVWAWFIDIFAVACVVFSVTGLVLLQLYAKARPITWPLVIGGLAVPALLVVLFVHL